MAAPFLAAVPTSIPPTMHVAAPLPRNSRPQLTKGSFAPTTASMPPTAASHFEPLPQPLVHEPSAASFMEAEVSRMIRIPRWEALGRHHRPAPVVGVPRRPGGRTRAGKAEDRRSAATAADRSAAGA